MLRQSAAVHETLRSNDADENCPACSASGKVAEQVGDFPLAVASHHVLFPESEGLSTTQSFTHSRASTENLNKTATSAPLPVHESCERSVNASLVGLGSRHVIDRILAVT